MGNESCKAKKKLEIVCILQTAVNLLQFSSISYYSPSFQMLMDHYGKFLVDS
jgi:hypothetical protein